MSELNLDAPEIKKLVEDAVEKEREAAEQRTKDLSAKNTSLLNEVKSLKIKLKDFNPDEITKLKEMAKDLEEQKHKAAVDNNDTPALVKKYEDRISEMMALHQKEVEEAKLTTEKIQSSYTQKITESTVLEALGKKKVSPKAMKNNILPLVETQFTEDGQFQTYVKNPDGSQRFDPKTNQPFTVDMLLDELSLQDDFAPLFPQASGGGAGNGDGGHSNVSSVSKLSDLKTFEEKKAYRDKFGEEAYNQLINNG